MLYNDKYDRLNMIDNNKIKKNMLFILLKK